MKYLVVYHNCLYTCIYIAQLNVRAQTIKPLSYYITMTKQRAHS